jgi:hypothetical protein
MTLKISSIFITLYIFKISFGQCIHANRYSLNSTEASAGIQLATETKNIVIQEFNTLEQFFKLDLNLIMINHEFGPHYDSELDAVVTDNNFLNEVSTLSYGNERVKAILAHEFAHALQFHAGLMNLWTGGKKIELHADFLAGYYLGRNGMIPKGKLTAFSQEFFERGDFLPFHNISHHGTPEERRCAFLEGYRVAVKYNFNLQQAFNCGVDYIKLLYPCDPFGIIREYSKTEYNNVNYNQPTGSYTFKSSQKVMGFYNLYYQPLGYAGPGNDCVFNNLTPGTYVVVPGRVKKSGKVKYYSPYSFTVKPNHMGAFKINQVGMFAIRTYSITF